MCVNASLVYRQICLLGHVQRMSREMIGRIHEAGDAGEDMRGRSL